MDVRLAIPQPGLSLGSVTEERARGVREAVDLLVSAMSSENVGVVFRELFESRWPACDLSSEMESTPLRAAWAVVSSWIVGRLVGDLPCGASLADSEKWLIGGDHRQLPTLSGLIDADNLERARKCLARSLYDGDFAALLPYVLDPHGPGSRLSVMRDPGTRVARASKKQQGVFYTPADVAEYMAREVLSEYGGTLEETHVLDPACGSGVYMRAMLAVLQEEDETCNALGLVQNCLYGFDISALSVESACFVLLYDCFDSVRRLGIAPLRAWHLLRLNFAVVDALRVVHNKQASLNKEATAQRDALRRELSESHAMPCTLPDKRREQRCEGWFGLSPRGHELSNIFPEVENGFEVVVGNPPYAPIGMRDDWDFLRVQYDCLRDCPSGSGNLYPLFIEMSWRLARCGRNAAALVVPLSIAYRRGGQFSACRRAMMKQGGRWRFAFFDREPHALFGEDVKTRNAIVLRRESTDDPGRGERSTVETGPLRKWTSRSRHRLFSSIEFTSLDGFDVSNGVPKVDGVRQAAAAARLMASLCSLKSTWRGIRSCLPVSAFEKDGPPRVFLGSTAYNFLNVFRPHRFARKGGGNRLSENPVAVMEFADEITARQVFAVLSSRLVFWWWHVNGDGFHVARWFVENIPFGRESICGAAGRQLAELGEQLWAAFQTSRIVSLNGGRESIAYRPFTCERERDMIDEILTSIAGIERAFCQDLREFVYSTIVVDEEEGRRRLLGIELNRVDPQ